MSGVRSGPRLEHLVALKRRIEHDAAFIAAARQAVPDLLDALDEAEEGLDDWAVLAGKTLTRAEAAEAEVARLRSELAWKGGWK